MSGDCEPVVQSAIGTATCVVASGLLIEDIIIDKYGALQPEQLVAFLRDQDASLARLTRRLNEIEASAFRDTEEFELRVKNRVLSSLRHGDHQPDGTSHPPARPTDVRVDLPRDQWKDGIHLDSCRDRHLQPDNDVHLNHENNCGPRYSQGKQEFCTTKGCWTHGKGSSASILSSTNSTPEPTEKATSSYKDIAPETDYQPYKLSNSIWTASFFIGHKSIGTAASGLVLFLLIINTLAQGTFVGVTASRLTDHIFTPEHILGLERWRQNVGHNVQYYDKVSDQSLVAKVCGMDKTVPVEISDNKLTLVEAIDSFLPTEDIFGVAFSGPALCTVAILCWSLRALGELNDIFEMFMSLRSIPWEGQSKVISNADNTVFYFAAICTPRRLWIVLILLIRIGICVSLWKYGTLFLINYSIEPADLVLNAVALEIVLNIDEGVFVMAPNTVKTLFQNLAPLPRPPRMTWKGLDLASLVLSVMLVTWLLIHTFFVIIPQVDRIASANATLCDGDLDFVYAVDPFYFVYSAKTGHSATEEAIALFRQAVSELISPEKMSYRNVSSTVSGTFGAAVQAVGETVAQLQLRPSLTPEESLAALGAMYWNADGCLDVLSMGVTITMQELAAKFGMTETPWSCTDLASLCLNSTQVVAVCPVTCGCNLPVAPLLLNSAEYGCRSDCSGEDFLWSTVDELPCEELTPAELRKTEHWPSWAQQVNDQAILNFGRYPQQLQFVCGASAGGCADMMLEMGCGFITYWNTALHYLTQFDGLDMCLGTLKPGETLLKPLGPVCPMTCGCLNATEDEAKEKRCPGTCQLA